MILKVGVATSQVGRVKYLRGRGKVDDKSIFFFNYFINSLWIYVRILEIKNNFLITSLNGHYKYWKQYKYVF